MIDLHRVFQDLEELIKNLLKIIHKGVYLMDIGHFQVDQYYLR